MFEIQKGPDALRFYLTGAASDGGAQTDPNLSLGKYRSSTEVLQLNADYTTENFLISFTAGANGTGTGYVQQSFRNFRWKAPGEDDYGPWVYVSGAVKVLYAASGRDKYIRIQRLGDTSAVVTVTLTEDANNVIALDEVSSAEAAAGDAEYRCFCMKNEGANTLANICLWLGPLGYARVPSEGQLPDDGAGEIEIYRFDLSSWPDSGFARIIRADGSLREIVYFRERTNKILYVPSGGRGLLDTTASMGRPDDSIIPVPGIAIGGESPSPPGVFQDKTGDGEGSEPAAVTWVTSITARSGLYIATLPSLPDEGIYGIWIKRLAPPTMKNQKTIRNFIKCGFSAA